MPYGSRPATPSRRHAVPAVVKPREGVASEDVVLVRDAGELAAAVAAIRDRRPGEALVVEEYLDGPLHTLETLGDGERLQVLGGFRTTLGPLPYFVEERLDWDAARRAREQVLRRAGRARRRLRRLPHRVRRDRRPGRGSSRSTTGSSATTATSCSPTCSGVPLFERILRAHLGEPLPRAAYRAPSAGHGRAVEP